MYSVVHKLFKTALPLILLLALTANAWSNDGRILSFEGDVQVNGQPADTSTLLYNEDKIVTAVGASVKIVLSDNSVLDIDSDSEIQLSDYNYSPSNPEENKSEISVVEGTLRYVSGLIAKEDPDDIGFTAGNSTIGVRGSFTEIEHDGVNVNVESMIGEATIINKEDKGQKDPIIVPTGKTTRTDPTTGEVLITASTASNPVNAVVQAIAAAAPDASTGSMDEGCSLGTNPLRSKAVPDVNEETANAIASQLKDLSKGDLMMVIAVLINNARHLCIDSVTVANTIAIIATVRPDAAADVVFVSSLLDGEHENEYVAAAIKAAPDREGEILQARDAANAARDNSDTVDQAPIGTPNLEQDIPPGGAPSPE
jgi:hypothetical protein